MREEVIDLMTYSTHLERDGGGGKEDYFSYVIE